MTEHLTHTIPVGYALHLAALVAEWNVSKDALCEGILAPTDLEDGAPPVPLATMIRLVERAQELTREPALGVFFGAKMRVSSHGHLGLAVLTALTVRDALDLAVRYAPTRTTAIGLKLEIEDDRAFLELEEHADFGVAREAMLTAILIGIREIAMSLTESLGSVELEFPFDACVYQPKLQELGIPAKFGSRKTRMSFDVSCLDRPLLFSDREATRLAQEQCERELAALQAHPRTMTKRVRSVLAIGAGEIPSVESVAATLGLSTRTLKRRLAEEGVTFTLVLGELQLERATALLRHHELSLDDVATRLGYADKTSFSRAFRRWTKMTPAAFRRASPTLAEESPSQS